MKQCALQKQYRDDTIGGKGVTDCGAAGKADRPAEAVSRRLHVHGARSPGQERVRLLLVRSQITHSPQNQALECSARYWL